MTSTHWPCNLSSLSLTTSFNSNFNYLHNWEFSSVDISDEVEDTLRIIRQRYDQIAAFKTKDCFQSNDVAQVSE